MKKKTWLQMGAALVVAWVSSYAVGATSVKIISSAMRENDPTIMDVTYYVTSDSEKVDTRALAFQDGVRSFVNVVRPETFLEGSVIGDGVPANTENKFSWRVSADWKIDLAKVSIEVLAKPAGTGVVPLHWVTIPKTEDSVEVTISTTDLTDKQALDALYWLYADKDETLTLKNGVLSDKNGTLVSGRELSNCRGNVGRHIYEKMGYDYLTFDAPYVASYASIVRRTTMASNYGYVCSKVDATAEQKMGNGLYMVVSLDVLPFKVTYLDAVPAGGWSSDKYKTNKLVLRRIDASDGTTYYAGVFEVTEAQWYKVMGGTATTSTKPKNDVSWNSIRGDTSVYDWPTVTGVAQNSFMGVLRLMTGLQTFDLPNETEWEYAARAGVTTKYLCGDTETGLDDYAWYLANSDGGTHEVGTRQANAWGLYDVHGNTWEWCLNRYYSDCSLRVLRGGSYDYDAPYCALTYRDHYLAYYAKSDNGFRLYCRAEGK
jgi:hypothetical protein